MATTKPGFYEFFAGAGMARLALQADWDCLFANDICEKKGAAYRSNFGVASNFAVGDIGHLEADSFPGRATLSWASFPCQDLSLAGNRLGLSAERSGTFWPFWDLMRDLQRLGRPAPIIVLENVVGTITSHNGSDFSSILNALVAAGYRVGPLVIDAVHFLPQSRPRLFLIAVNDSVKVPDDLLDDTPVQPFHHTKLVHSYRQQSPDVRASWVWWRFRLPNKRKKTLSSLIETESSVAWHSRSETRRLLSLMSPLHREKVREAKKLDRRIVGTVYKRTRRDSAGNKVQRAEVRFDQISGCLRTPAGGSSRQTILVVEGRKIRSRLLSPREAARLMGVPDKYALPVNYNEAYHLMGDGVVVPVVSALNKHLLLPLAQFGAGCLVELIKERDLPGRVGHCDPLPRVLAGGSEA